MNAHAAILLPGLAMVALTFIVLIVMFRRRVAQMKRDRIHPQAVATSAQAASLFTDTGPADNFRNLFETPVLFYFALAVAAITDQTGVVTLALAWGYVAARAAHSWVQCGRNKVMHRFRAFLASVCLLLALWVWLGYGLLTA